ncbi:hypothetical protein K435DRAFT_861879 [Dendrothele bispora CBS 962.96]|uniref:Uncharacterized protein n=1 Tax=Dendrothele bispora (strain CBS 962.96) TaxID=1314807 RepID=A0A4S8LVF9_DENBC|nr:hypothetical protein K435DRAFT_861879 [Dendrothele bispora CBS 962.96]
MVYVLTPRFTESLAWICGERNRALPSGGKPAPRDGPNPSGVLVHRDGGRVPEPQQPETPEWPEEIPPTYDSLVLDGDERPRNGKGVGGGGGGEGGASGSGQRRE